MDVEEKLIWQYFYRENDTSNYEMYDIFAVKAGPSILLEVGRWNFDNGIELIKSINRWDRRTNLQQTTFVNCFAYNPGWAEFTKDKSGTKGYIQDMLFYITDKLNLTIAIIESPWGSKLLDNGSWTSEFGFLQRKEADVVSTGMGISLQRSHFFDFPITTHRAPITLIAAIPKGVSPNMWVYVEVFGFHQWMIFIALLVLMVLGLSVFHALGDDQSGREFGTKRGSDKNYQLNSVSSALSMVCLYTIQMGSHTNSKKLATRLLTFTMSILTLLFFAFYTTDITAEMTSGPSNIPIRTFEDVLHHNYKVIASSPYFANILANSKPGSAKFEVYNNHFEMNSDLDESINAIIQDSNSKMLLYTEPSALIPTTPAEKMLTDQLFALKMDNPIVGLTCLALQNDSEFLQIFNHYILKALEGGEFKRLYRNYHMDLYTKENFEMIEAQPLGINNVMFCFICLGFGIGLSLIQVMMELMGQKISKKQIIAKANGRGGGAKMSTIGEERIQRDRERRGGTMTVKREGRGQWM